MDSQAEIIARDQERMQRLKAADYAAVAEFLTDDLVHIHANGLTENKAEYLANAQAKLEFLEMERSDYHVRNYGDIAVATGLLKQTIRVKGPGIVVSVEIATTQVWRKDAGQWRLSSFQATKQEGH